MAKLYPPYIEGVIPACCVDGTQAILTVPFSMNKAVSLTDFSGIAIKIKTVQTNEYIYSEKTPIENINFIRQTLSANFTLTLSNNSKFTAGQYYKVQIAYCDNTAARTPGYYSTVGVFKLTTRPTVEILDLTTGIDNVATNRLFYTGVYRQWSDDETVNMDVSEKVNEFCFNLYDLGDSNGQKLIATSDWQVHNSSTDIVSYESTDQYSFTYSLKPNRNYGIEYRIRTINGWEDSSGIYPIMNKIGVDPEINADFYYSVDFDNGFIELFLQPKDIETHNYSNGTFLITRASDEDNYTNWYELYRFSLRDVDVLSEWKFKDFTVKHGVNYVYSLQQYNFKGLYSTRLYAVDKETNSRYAQADFEDSFLYDGEKQLKIRFNPKMSSFKIDKLEQKIETLGNKYPFIVRNSKVEYKEFPIAGLISYQSDEANLFIDDADLGLTTNYTSKPRSAVAGTPAGREAELYLKPYTTSNETYNIVAERIFKMNVLEWLNNGQPKLFKSPTEGNFLVRLLNVSLTPEEKIGRLLHNFSATAYEIADSDYNTLNKYGILSVTYPDELQYRIGSIDFSNYQPGDIIEPLTEQETADAQDAQADRIAELQEQLSAKQQTLKTAYQALYNEYSAFLNSNSGSSINYQTALVNVETLEAEIANLKRQIQEANDESNRLSNLFYYYRINIPTVEGFLEFRDFIPGTTFYIYDMSTGTEFSSTIGITGAMTISLEGHQFGGLRLGSYEPLPPYGLLTYKYLALADNKFEKIYDMNLQQVTRRQFIGPQVIIDRENPSDEIYNIKHQLVGFYSPWIEHRRIESIFIDNLGNVWEFDETKTTFNEQKGELMDTSLLSETVLYKAYYDQEGHYDYRNWGFIYNTTDEELSEYGWKDIFIDPVVNYTVTIDGKVLDIPASAEAEVINHLLTDFTEQGFKYLEIGNGLTLDVSYTLSEIVYNIEESDNALLAKYNEYQIAEEQYNRTLAEPGDDPLAIEKAAYTKNRLWVEYCELVTSKLAAMS